MLSSVDVLVFDIQDAGARFYTYSCTMLYALEEAAKAHLPFYVLDRPNPVTGAARRRADAGFGSCRVSSAATPMPVRHGLTLGELATMANAERKLERRPARGQDVQTGNAVTGSIPPVSPGSILHRTCAA